MNTNNRFIVAALAAFVSATATMAFAEEADLSVEARAEWCKKDIDDSTWRPGFLDVSTPSVVWFRWHVAVEEDVVRSDDSGDGETLGGQMEIRIPSEQPDFRFVCKGMTGADEVWFDGEKIGSTGMDGKTDPIGVARDYPISRTGLKVGNHTLAVRFVNLRRAGTLGDPSFAWKGGRQSLSHGALFTTRVESKSVPANLLPAKTAPAKDAGGK